MERILILSVICIVTPLIGYHFGSLNSVVLPAWLIIGGGFLLNKGRTTEILMLFGIPFAIFYFIGGGVVDVDTGVVLVKFLILVSLAILVYNIVIFVKDFNGITDVTNVVSKDEPDYIWVKSMVICLTSGWILFCLFWAVYIGRIWWSLWKS